MTDILTTRVGRYASDFLNTSAEVNSQRFAEGIMDCLVGTVDDLRRRAVSCRAAQHAYALGSEDAARVRGKAAAYDHAAEMLEGLYK